MTFAIKPTYVENPGPVYFLDDVTETRGLVFQPDVYTLAEVLAELTGGGILDVGCGWGDKLAAIHARHPGWDFTGVDYGDNIEHCKRTYEWGTWLDVDLELFRVMDATGDIVICSDVVEHLVDPRPLLHVLRDSGATAIIFSTPERDVQHGANHNGPSPNLCHVREWNASEFREFLTAEGLTVRHQGLTRGHDQSYVMPTQLAICTPRARHTGPRS